MTCVFDYLGSQLVNHIFRGSTFTKPTVLGIGLCTSVPNDALTTLAGYEVSGGNYSRIALNPSDLNWSTPSIVSGFSNMTTSSLATISFPVANANWGTIVACIIADSTLTGGNLYMWTSFGSGTIVNSGGSFAFAPNGLTVQVDN